METRILAAMARDGFERVLAIHDRRSRLRAFLGVHDTSVGPALGGIRRWAYLEENQALRDCLRLALAMSRKCCLADVAAGGGKLVLIDAPGVDWERAYAYVGRVVQSLGGLFYTGPDVGTGERELEWVARATEFVTHPGPSGPGRLSDATAEGVFAGIAAALRHVDGEEDWPRRRVVVQGLGAVGLRLARRLVERGVSVVAADVDGGKAEAARRELAIELADPSRELDLSCDVFAPCALGGILHDLTVERLACRIVAGGANNVLVRTEHALRLFERGILYVPDFVINAGALVRGATFHLDGRREPIERIGERIGRTTSELLRRASEAGEAPETVALREADRRITERRREDEPALS